MAKLSDLFGRKVGETDKFPSRLGARRGNGNGDGDHINVENFSDVGSRMGEENEVLRNLLTDTGRKIGELDELKEAFDKIVHAVQLDAARARTGKVADARPHRHAGRVARGLRDAAHRILPDRTQGHRARSRSPNGCARISNCRANPTARWKATASNCPTTFPPATPRSPNSSASSRRKPAQRRTLEREPPHAAGSARRRRKAHRRTRRRVGRRAREAGAAGRREALAADWPSTKRSTRPPASPAASPRARTR